MNTGLRAAHTLHHGFDRSVGGTTAAFLAGLARAEIWGSRGADGRISVPPLCGADPVRVADYGVVRRWSWVAAPEPAQPLDRPFAYALIQLHGADTALLHVVDVDTEDALRVGMPVRAEWRAERHGSVLDIRAFVPGDAGPLAPPRDPPEQLHVVSDRVIQYTFEPGLVLSRFYRALAERRIVGGRCPLCRKVYVPPHDRCPTCGTGAMATVDVAATGVIESFTVVHLPMPGLDMEIPFGWARIRLDGADVSFPHVLGGVALDDVRVGERVEAVWAPSSEQEQSWEAIRHFRPRR